MAKRWYVVHAYSGYEKKVMHALRERITLSKMDDYFDEVLVPTEEVLEMRGGQKRKSERKFFPGYVLVHMELNDDTWHLVKDTPRVMGFIGGTAERPAPISDKEANKILQRMEDSEETPTHKTIYEPGEMVRVTDGPFNDFTGTVEAYAESGRQFDLAYCSEVIEHVPDVQGFAAATAKLLKPGAVLFLTLAIFVEMNFTNSYLDLGVQSQRAGIAGATHF